MTTLLTTLTFSVLASAYPMSPPQTRFGSGEISPLLWQRYDVENFDAACRTLENFLVITPGIITRRPGTEYVRITDLNHRPRLLPFVYSEDDAYILEFTDNTLRFYRDGGLVLSGGVPYIISTIFEEGDLPNLQYYQSGDVMYIVDGNDWPQKLTRLGHTSWTIADVVIDDGPFRTENITATTVTPSATTGAITLTASTAIFDANMVGGYWQIRQLQPIVHDTNTFSAVDAGNSLTCPDGVQFECTLSGTCTATIEIQVSYDSGVNWTAHSTYVGTGGAIPTPAGVLENDTGDDALLRVACTAYTAGSVTYDLWVHAHMNNGVVKITDYNSTTDVNATVITALIEPNATTYWSEGCWSEYRGFPHCVSFNAERILYANTAHQPLTIWASYSGDYERFRAGTNDADAFAFTLSLAQQNPIQWLLGDHSQYWLAGTLARTVEIRPLDSAGGFTPSNFPRISSGVAIGNRPILPTLADDVAIFASRTGKKLYQVNYDHQTEALTAPELTMWADHITGTGLTEMAYTQEPTQTLWCVREDGVLAALTFYRAYSILGWSRQVFDGNVVSVASIPGSGRDELWLAVQRAVNGTDYYFVERLRPVDPSADIEDVCFLDCSESWDGGAARTITNITQANPVVVTVQVWPTDGNGVNLADGDEVRIRSVGGMTELNDDVFTVADANAVTRTFHLHSGGADVDTTGYTAYTSGGTVQEVEDTFTGLDQFAGTTVTVIADGVPQGSVSVNGTGGFTLTDHYNTVHAGLNYTSKFQSLPVEMLTWRTSGTTVGTTKTLDGLVVSLYNSCGGQYGATEAALRDIPWTRNPTDTGTPPVLKTEPVNLGRIGGYNNKELTYWLEQTQPWPMTIRGLVPQVTVH